jgi:hypothetical protein
MGLGRDVCGADWHDHHCITADGHHLRCATYELKRRKTNFKEKNLALVFEKIVPYLAQKIIRYSDETGFDRNCGVG